MLHRQDVARLSLRRAEIERRQERAAGKMIRPHADEVDELERDWSLRPERGNGDAAGEQVVVPAGEIADLPGEVLADQRQGQRRPVVQLVPQLESIEGGEDRFAHRRFRGSVLGDLQVPVDQMADRVGPGVRGAAEVAQPRQRRQKPLDGPAECVQLLAVGALDVGERDDIAPRRSGRIVTCHLHVPTEPQPLQAELPRVVTARKKSLGVFFLSVPTMADAELVGPVEPVSCIRAVDAEASQEAWIQQHLEDARPGERFESQIEQVEQPLTEDAEPIGRVIAEVVGEQPRRPLEDAAQGRAVRIHVGDEDGDIGLPKRRIAVKLIDDAAVHRLHLAPDAGAADDLQRAVLRKLVRLAGPAEKLVLQTMQYGRLGLLRPRLAIESDAAERRIVREIADEPETLRSGPAPDVKKLGAGPIVGAIVPAVGGGEGGHRIAVRRGKPADQRIDVIDAQIEKRSEDVERPQMQRRHLRQPEQVQAPARRRSVFADVLQHLGDILRQRLQVPARPAVEQGSPSVRLAGDAAENGALGPFPIAPAENAGEEEVVVEPRLDDRFLTVVLVVADQVADAGGQIAGPATAEARESGDRLGARAVDGAFAEILQRPEIGIVAVEQRRQDEEPIGRVVEQLRRRRVRTRVDEQQTVPESLFEEAEAEVDGDVELAGEVQLEPLFDDAVGHDDRLRHEEAFRRLPGPHLVSELIGEDFRIGSQEQRAHYVHCRGGSVDGRYGKERWGCRAAPTKPTNWVRCPRLCVGMRHDSTFDPHRCSDVPTHAHAKPWAWHAARAAFDFR